MCGKATESVPHILAGCGALARTLENRIDATIVDKETFLFSLSTMVPSHSHT